MIANLTLEKITAFLIIPYNAFLLAVFAVCAVILMIPNTKKYNIKAEDITQKSKDKNVNTVMIDIRNNPEKRLPRSKILNIKELNAASNLNKHLKNKNDTIILVAEGQKDGIESLKILKHQGYNSVFILENGIQGWLNAGLPLASLNK